MLKIGSHAKFTKQDQVILVKKNTYNECALRNNSTENTQNLC